MDVIFSNSWLISGVIMNVVLVVGINLLLAIHDGEATVGDALRTFFMIPLCLIPYLFVALAAIGSLVFVCGQFWDKKIWEKEK